MNFSHSLLIVDPDARDRRILEVSLRRAGFSVRAAASYDEAVELVREYIPQVIISDTQLGPKSGFDLATQLKKVEAKASTPIVFLSSDLSSSSKMRGFEVGGVEFLAKPVLIKEILEAVHRVLTRDTASEPTAATEGMLSGQLQAFRLVDIVQLFEAGDRQGVASLSSDFELSGGWVRRGTEHGTFRFAHGQLINAQLHTLKGPDAFYRALLWKNGHFDLKFEVRSTELIDPDAHVDMSTEALLIEGMHRVDRWELLLNRLPNRGAALSINYPQLGRRFNALPPQVQELVHLFDGKRQVFEVAALSSAADVTSLDIIERLFDEKVLIANSEDSAHSVEAWLAEVDEFPRGDASQEVEISVENARQSYADEPDVPVDDEDEVQEGDTSPLILSDASETAEIAPPKLSRHTLSTRRVGPAESSQPIPKELPQKTSSQRPKLSVQRVSSIGRSPYLLEGRQWSELQLAESGTPLPEPVAESAIPKPQSQADQETLIVRRRQTPVVDPVTEFFENSNDTEELDWDPQTDRGRVTPMLAVASFVLIGGVLGAFLYQGEHAADAAAETSKNPVATRSLEPKPEVAELKVPARLEPVQPEPSLVVVPPPAATVSKPTAPLRRKKSDVAPRNRPRRKKSAISPEAIKGALQRAENALRAEQLDVAADAFEQVLELDDTSSAAHSGLAYTFLAREDLSSADEHARTALAINSTNARAHLVLGTIAQNQGRMTRACWRYRRYLSAGAGPMGFEIRSIVDQRCRS